MNKRFTLLCFLWLVRIATSFAQSNLIPSGGISSFSPYPSTQTVGCPVRFVPNEYDPGTATCGPTWTVDGVDMGPNEELQVTWTTPGSHTVQLTPNCVPGSSGTITRTYTVAAAPTPAIGLQSAIAPASTSASSATFCEQRDDPGVALFAPNGATNVQWTGDYIVRKDQRWTSFNGVYGNYSSINVRPPETATYTLTCKVPNHACPITMQFTVVILPTVRQVAVSGTTRYGDGSLTLAIDDFDFRLAYTWHEQQGGPALANPVSTGRRFTTPYLSTSRDYYVKVVGCNDYWQRVPVTLYRAQIEYEVQTSTWRVPAGSVALNPVDGVRLRAVATGATGYQWYKGGAAIAGATAAVYQATQPGIYGVEATVNNAAVPAQPVQVTAPLAEQQVNGQYIAYSSETAVLKAGVTDQAGVLALGTAERLQTVTYADGLGRELQRVVVQSSPLKSDVVQPLEYNEFGRADARYLPYAGSGAVGTHGRFQEDAIDQAFAFYQGTYAVAQDGLPLSTVSREASPLGRVTASTLPGVAWEAHPSGVSYQTNTTGTGGDNVRRWEWATLSGQQLYTAGSLYKTVTTDPDGRTTIVFQDKLGRTVLQRKLLNNGPGDKLDTYFVYNEAGVQQYVIPPAAVAQMQQSSQWSGFSADFIARWLYRYVYDEEGRLIERQFPGAEPVQLVYDRYDRAVLVQDGNGRNTSQPRWYFTKYDSRNRPVVEGLYFDGSSRAQLQDDADNWPGSDYEEKPDGTDRYTTGNSFPLVEDMGSGVVLSQTFYDDYDLIDPAQYSYRSQDLGADEPQAVERPRGAVTVSYKRVVGPNERYSDDWLITALFYDAYGNVVQKQSNNYLNRDTHLPDVTTMVYRDHGFVPQLLRSVKKQDTGIYLPVTVFNRFGYDHAGRLLQVWQRHAYNGRLEEEVLVASNAYNELGQLIEKNLHSRDGGESFLQSEDFRYNLHGRLTHINNSTLSNDDVTNNDSNDIFGLELVREQRDTWLGNTARYDGGISAVKWKTHNGTATARQNPELERSYTFAYDGIGRLLSADYAAKNAAGARVEIGAYNEAVYGYDFNGNIRGFQRYTQTTSAASRQLIDDMLMSYTDANGHPGNKLTAVDDYAPAAGGFQDRAASRAEYRYDDNGSLTGDDNKGMSLRYNALNKVEAQETSAGTIEYVYDACGNVLGRWVQSSTPKEIYYVDGITYETSADVNGLASVPTPEGRAMALAHRPDRLTYEYHLRDHLGNLRVAFRAESRTEQLHLSSESNEQDGAYPHFTNVASTRNQDFTPKHGSYMAAVNSPDPLGFTPGPQTSIPVLDGDRLKIKLFYSTPSGTQYGRAASAPAQESVTPSLALLPTLAVPLATAADGAKEQPRGQSRLVPGLQLSVSGLLTALTTKHKQPSAAAKIIPGVTRQDAVVQWILYNEDNQEVRRGRMVAPVVAADYQWRPLSLALDVDLSAQESRKGHLQVTLLNSGGQYVYFDSLTVLQPKDELVVSQENHYYPFGLAMSGVAVNTSIANQSSKLLYNGGAELQDEILGDEAVYNTYYRPYDPALGRFLGIDPIADNYGDQTPYGYSYNDPINYNDPFGDSPTEYSSLAQLLQRIIEKGLDGVDTGYYTIKNGRVDVNLNIDTSSGRLMIGFDWQISASMPTANGGVQTFVYKDITWLDYSTREMKQAAAQEEKLDEIQDAIGHFGLVPGFGDVADGVNAIIYLTRGKPGKALMSAASMLPGVGIAVGGAALSFYKIAKNSATIAKSASRMHSTTTVIKNAVKNAGIAWKNKHWSWAKGGHAKWLVDDVPTVDSWVRDAVNSPNARILSNVGSINDPDAYVIIADLGFAVGTRGETGVKVVLAPTTNFIFSAYPYFIK